MNFIKKAALAVCVSSIIATQASASIVISIFAGRLDNATGSAPIGAGTLLQLVNLGQNGQFDPISVGDGDVLELAQWVSGDDSVLNLSFLIDGAAGDFPTTAAFDLARPSIPEPTNGIMNRVFDFGANTIPLNTKIGLRWFPGLQASDFSSITLQAGQAYGEFTRQSAPQYGNALWMINVADGAITFDSLATTEITGLDSAAAGNASLTVVPEPAAIGLSLLGAAGLAMMRRRRA